MLEVSDDQAQVEESFSDMDEDAMADPTYVWQPKLERYYTALEDIGAHDGTARTRAKSALRRSKPLKTMALSPLTAGKASDVDWLFTEKRKLTPSQKHKKKNFNKEQSQEMTEGISGSRTVQLFERSGDLVALRAGRVGLVRKMNLVEDAIQG